MSFWRLPVVKLGQISVTSRANSSVTALRPLPRFSARSLTSSRLSFKRPMSSVNEGATALDQSHTYGNFDLVKRFKVNHTDVTVSKWQSRITGLRVLHLDYEAPLVKGYFVIPTEIFNDSGCPHTLEHLVFLGSEKYPYKGVLDQFANRSFADGTNAWTDTDHTAYTVTTAGEQGFLQLLPVYIDHILYPTITKSGYVTEVHHINGKGEDSGVVYSEMQARENTQQDIMALRAQRLLYHAESGYHSDTGGLLESIRTLSVEQIREYHSGNYLPHNLALIVAGRFSNGTHSLLKVVQEQVEPSIIAHGQNQGRLPPGWKRPFLETHSSLRLPIPERIVHVAEFPDKDETMGELLLAFDGPAPEQYLERQALSILASYLTSSAVAPLAREFIEIESPLCTYIYFEQTVRPKIIDLRIYAGTVPTEHLGTLDVKIKDSLQHIVRDGIDMKRMPMVINREERRARKSLEDYGGAQFTSAVINDLLVGPDDSSELPTALDEIDQIAQLRHWSSEQWVDLIKRYFIDSPYVVVRGKPSATIAKSLETEEKARIAAQVERLGPEGLARAANIVDEANAENSKEIPPDIITSFPVPNIDSISWINVQSVQEVGEGRHAKVARMATRLAEHLASDGKELPFFVQYDHVSSDFVTVDAVFSLDKLPDHLRPYLSIYEQSFFSLPVKRHSGEYLSFEDVVNGLDSDTVDYCADLGILEGFTEMLRVSIKVETSTYEVAVAWLRDLVYGSEFSKERLQVSAAKWQQSLVEQKRDGFLVQSAISWETLFNESSSARAAGLLLQGDFIPKLVKQLQECPGEAISAFEELRRILTNPSSVRFSVRGDVLGIKQPRSTWAKYFGDTLPKSQLDPVPDMTRILSPVGKEPMKTAVVASLATIETTYAEHTSKGPFGWDHPDVPALLTAAQLLNATEGYLWRFTRGLGLTYGTYVEVDPEVGHVNLSLEKCSNSTRAFEECAAVVSKLVDGSMELEQTSLDAAKSSLVYFVAARVSNAASAAVTSFLNQALKGVPQNFHVEQLEKCRAVTKEDVISVIRQYFLPIFDPATSVAIVVTAPSRADKISADLAAAGFEVTRRTIDAGSDEMGEGEEGSADDSDGDSDGSDR